MLDILRIIGILAFGMFCGWIIHKAMKNTDENEESEESGKNEKR